jgi:flavin-dependent dehydrogenase
VRILLIGGGIGGTAAAIAVRKVGLAPLVLERAPELGRISARLDPSTCGAGERRSAAVRAPEL